MSQNISNMNLNPYQQYNQQQNTNFTASPNASTQISNKGIVQNNPILNAATAPPANPLSFATAAIVSAAGLFSINNFINNQLLDKQYENTFFKKIETFVNDYTKDSKVQAVLTKLSELKTWVINQGKKSEILRTLFTKPSIGGSVAQPQAAGAKGHLASRALEVMKKYQKEYKAEHGVEFKEFDAILKKAGKEPYKYYDDIMDFISKLSPEVKNKIIEKKAWWGFGLVKNKSSLQEIVNKDILIQNYKGAGKKLGQKVAGYLMRGTECVTNGIFSGKGQVLVQALMVAQAMNEASKAEKGEKFSSFMASWIELMSYLATMGLQIRVVNSIAGLGNIGLSETQAKDRLKFIEIANKAAKAGDHSEYQRALAEIKNLNNISKTNTKLHQIPIKWLGKIARFGRLKETVKPLKATKLGTVFAKIPYSLKVGVGYVGRVALLMGVVIPFFSGIAKKMSYAIFGKPVKTIEREKQKEKEEELKAQQAELEQQQKMQETQQSQTTTTQQVPQTTQASKPGNLVEQLNNKYKNPQPTPMAAQTISQAAPAAAPIKTPEAAAGIKRTYVPNPILGQENIINSAATRSAQIEAVMRQADIAEAQAQKYL